MSFLSGIPIVGGMFGRDPKLNTVDLDKGTSALVDASAQRVIHETPEQIRQQLTQGIGTELPQMPIEQQAAQSGQDPNLLGAIRRQYSAKANQSVQRLKDQAHLDAQLEKGKRMSEFSRVAIARQQVQTQNFEALAQAYQQNQAARAQMISSLINLGGTAYALHSMNTKPGSNGPVNGTMTANENPSANGQMFNYTLPNF
jgi:hypothetical protein